MPVQNNEQVKGGPGSAGIGVPVRRKEDARLLVGQGGFSDDVNLPGQAYAVMVRTPHAHARIRAIDATAADAAPGVITVLTGADALAAGLQGIPHAHTPGSPPDIRLANRDGSTIFISPHPVLPADKVRFVGEAVAMVIAETLAAAKDGAELVEVDYEPLPAVVVTRKAVEADAARLWDEAANVTIDADVGNAAATDAAFARADHVVRLESWVQRATGVPMEPRVAVGDYDPATGRHTLYAGSGGVVRQKHEVAAVLGVDPSLVRVVARDVGGNFGTRNSLYPEFALVVWAAKLIGRPVKWTCERREAFLSDYQGRDLDATLELALDRAGNFLAVRGSIISNIGSHTVSYVPLIKGSGLLTNVYRVPVAYVRSRAALSSTPPTHPYRSAGRPEAIYLIERLVDIAAREHGFDRIALRRRNLFPAEGMPQNPLGLTYDGGAYEKVMDKALALGDWDGFPARRAESRARGRLRGIGLANYIEITSGAPREWTRITVRPEGRRIDLAIGTLASGQGHETSFAQLLVDWLSVPFESVRFISGDTDIVPIGGGSHSGRSMRMASIVMGRARDELIAKGRRIAAQALEAAEADIEFVGGRFAVKGTDRALDLFAVAHAGETRDDLPAELKGSLAAEYDEIIKAGGYPYGCHVCEVEIDPETGKVDLVRYAAVDDVGRAINPMILHGQAHGGITQGVGQALLEHVAYDDAGQLLAGSFMDYAMPHAHHLPPFATEISEVPSPSNPLGIRAGGEGGTTPALGVVVNAVVDALAEFGVRHVEMPVTSERVWRAIQEAKSNRYARA